MKKTLLLVGLLAVAATTAHAYVQPGPPAPGVASGPRAYRNEDALRVHDDVMVPHAVAPNDINGEPSPAVPEPGTMALASMGLLAAGAAMRRRREQQK